MKAPPVRPLRPIDVADLRCPRCGCPSLNGEQLSDPDYVDGVVYASTVWARDNRPYHQPCVDCMLLPPKSAPVFCWQDAAARWLHERTDKASLAADRFHLRWLDQHLHGVPLRAITATVLEQVTAARTAEGVRAATINRMLEVVRAILRRAVHVWGWLSEVPPVRMLDEPFHAPRILSRAEAQLLLGELPTHLADLAAFILATGLHQASVTGLCWDQIDLTACRAWVRPAKQRRPVLVPLDAEAMAIICRQRGQHRDRVFTFRGRPIKQVSTKAFTRAVQRAGFPEFRWRDLRRTWQAWQCADPASLLVPDRDPGGTPCRPR